MSQNIMVKKNELCAISLFLLIIMETAFENTPLQIYDLMINRILFLGEILLFILFLLTERYTKKFLQLLAFMLLFFFISYLVLNSSILFKMFMMGMVVTKIGIKRAFEIMFKFKITILVIVIFFAVTGIIPNEYSQVEKGIGIVQGYGLGYTHPNRLASSICSIILSFCGWKKDELTENQVLGIGIITIICFCITKSRTLLYCIIIFLALFILHKIKLIKGFIYKFLSLFGSILIPLCICISIILPLLLLSSSGIVQHIVYGINLMFSRRFTNIEHMFLAYPVSLTGGLFDTSKMNEIFGYSVVDNGYIRFLYQYGVIGLTIFGLISMLSFFKLKKNKEYVWEIIFIVVAIEGLLENIYVDIGSNLLIIFWAELFYSKRRKDIL